LFVPVIVDQRKYPGSCRSVRATVSMLSALLLAACAPPSPPPTLPATLTPQASLGLTPITVGDNAAAFFASPRAGQPASAARAFADLEWLADTLPTNPMWIGSANTDALLQLQQARNEARQALGIPSRASNQAVVNGLAAAAVALTRNDRAALTRALPRNVFTLGPEATVERLAQPPNVLLAQPALDQVAQGPNLGSAR
jgi:hypothetical protein